MWSTVEIDNKKCHVLEKGSDGPVILWMYFPHRGNELEHMEEVLDVELRSKSLTLVACEVSDWNAELSPWEAPGMTDGDRFLGGGNLTLKWLEDKVIPWVKGKYESSGELLIMGYSLAGLFSLWSMYETDVFSGAICASGSLWIEGWSDYVKANNVKGKCKVYLSLGGKEEKTNNARMATVGDRTREMEKVLKADENVTDSVFELNSGGHFADSVKRMVKGIKWMV